LAQWDCAGGTSKKFETHGLICDELGLSPFFFDLARDSAIAGALHDDTKLPPGDDVNAVFSGSFEMPNGMGPMRIVLVTDPAAPSRTDVREVIEPADALIIPSFSPTPLFQLDVAGKCVGGTFSGVALPGTINCAPDDTSLTVALKSEPFAPKGGRVRLELRALFDPRSIVSEGTTAIDWSKLLWREQPRVVITPVNATAWPGDAASPGTWIDPSTDLASKKSEFGELSKLPSVVMLTPHFRNRFLKRIDPDQVGRYRERQPNGAFVIGIAQGSGGTGLRRGRIKQEREHIQASSTFNYLIEGENRTDVAAVDGKRRFDPIVDANGYLLPGACNPEPGVSCTYEYRLAHAFRTFLDPTIVNDLRTAFTFEVEAFLNGRRVELRLLGPIQNTSKTCPGEGSAVTDEDHLVPATPMNRRVDCVVSGQADPVPPPDPSAARVTGFSFELTDGNEVRGRDKVFAFDGKPGDLLHLIATVRPRWNLDTKDYGSCLTPLQCPSPQTKPRSVANLLETDQDGIMKPWRPMRQTEFRLGLKATRTAADGTTSVRGLGLAAAPGQQRLDVARLFVPLYFNEDHEVLLTSGLPTDFRGWSRFMTRAVDYDAEGKPLPSLLPTPGLAFVRTEEAPANSFAGPSDISSTLKNRINAVSNCTAAPCPEGVRTLAADYDKRRTYPFAMRFYDPIPSQTVAEVWCKSFPAGSAPTLCASGAWNHTNYADLPGTCARSSKIRPCLIGPDKKIWIALPGEYRDRGIRQTSGYRGPERFGLDHNEILPAVSLPVLPQGAVSIFAPPLVSQTTSWSATGSIIGGIGVVASQSLNTANYLDINGDGYPDPIIGVTAFSTGPTGAPRTTWLAERSLAPLSKSGTALQGNLAIPLFGDGATTAIRENVATADAEFGHGVAGDIARSPLLPESVAATSGQASPEARLGVGVNLSFAAVLNKPNQDLVDVNGDGLPDAVEMSSDEKKFQLSYNVGHKLVGGGTLNIFDSLQGLTLSGGLGLNFGYKDRSGAFGGGVALSHNNATTRVALIDVNGDGLVDVVAPQVALSGSGFSAELNVAFNNGWTFESPIKIQIGKIGEWSFPDVGASESTIFSLGAHYTHYIGPLCPWTPFCYIVVNPALQTADVLGRTLVSVQDLNGDGLIDFVSTLGFYRGGVGDIPTYGFPGGKAHEKMAVHLNRFGKADKLKSIINSTGSTIGFDYAHVGNEQIQNPKPLYALSEIRVADGFRAHNTEAFEEDVLVTRVDYRNGVYDRAERQFLGFAKVVETAYGCADRQPENGMSRVSLSGDCQDRIEFRRRIERRFANDSIYTAGLLLSEEVTTDEAASGGAKVFHRTDYEYELRSHDRGGGTPARLDDPWAVCGLSGPDDPRLATGALDDICLRALGGARTTRIASLRIAAVDALGNTPDYTDATVTGRWAPKHLSPQLRLVRKNVFEKGDRALRSAVLFDYDVDGNVIAMVDFGHIRNIDDTIPDSADDYRVDIVYRPLAPDLTSVSGTWKTVAPEPLRDRPQRTVVRRGAKLDPFARILRSRSAVYQPVGAHVTALCHVLASDPQPEELAFDLCERLAATSLAEKANPSEEFDKAVRQAGYTPGDVVMTRITGYNPYGSPLGTLSPFNHRGDWIERVYGYDGDPLRQRPTEITEAHCLYRPDVAAATTGLVTEGPCRRDDGTRSPAVIAQPILISSAKYDPHHAKRYSETDINKNTLFFGYDGWGRITTMLSSWDKNDLDKNYIPEEAKEHCTAHGMTGSCSIMMHVAYLDHRVDAVTPWKARVARYVDRTLYAGHNTTNAALIEAVSYVDGLGHAVMTTRDADVCDPAKLSGSDRGWCLTADVRPVTASGLVARDALGRVLAEYYPVAVPTSAAPAAPAEFDRNTALEWETASTAANPAVLKKTRYSLDDMGRVIEALLPDTNAIRLDHAVAQDEHRAGLSTRFRTTLVDARCSAKEYLRDARGLITAVIEDHAGVFGTKSQTDDRRELATCSKPGEVAQSITTEFGTAAGERFAVTRYDHDPLGQLTDVALARDRPERVAAGASVTRERHAELARIRIAYDNLGRRTQIADPDRGIENTTFDGMGNATSRSHTPLVRGASGISKVVLQEFDTNRVVATLYPGAPDLDVHYLYDGFRDLDWNQWTREPPGDDENRIVDWLAAEVGETCDNCLGRLVAVRDASGMLVQRYDVFGQAQDQWRSMISAGSEKGRFHTRREYDRWGVMKSEHVREYQPVSAIKDCVQGKRYICDFDETVRLVYNQAGQVHRVEYDNATFAAFAYDAFGAPAAKWTVDGTTTRYVYNAIDRRLDRMTTELNSGAKIQDVTYSYDAGGNILRHVNLISSADPVNPEYLSDFSYGYDAANRIIGFEGAIKDKRAGDKALPKEIYGYDTLHRLHSIGIGTTTRIYEYVDELTIGVSHPLHAPRLIEEREPVIGQDAYKRTHAILHYDDWGNLSRINRTAADGALIARRVLRWDIENRLAGATITAREGDKPESTITAHYRYDHAGHRTVKKAPRLGIAGSDDDTLLYVSDFFARRWNQNTGSVHISAGQARIGSVRITRTPQGSERYAYLYHSDLPNGSVTVVTRPTGVHEFEGELIERLEYKPYGEPIQRPREIGPIAHSNSRTSDRLVDIGGEGAGPADRSTDRRLPFYAFSGKEYDLETGYLYFGARYYDPKLAIWLSSDPITKMLGPASPYAFAKNNPMSIVDPDGRLELPAWSDVMWTAKAFGALSEVYVGGALVAAAGCSTLVLCVAGVGAGALIIAHGIDQSRAAGLEFINGEPVDTYTSGMLQSAGMSRQAANITDATISIIGSLGGSSANAYLRISAKMAEDSAAKGLRLFQALKIHDEGSRALKYSEFLAIDKIAKSPFEKYKIIQAGVDTNIVERIGIGFFKLTLKGLTPRAELVPGMVGATGAAVRMHQNK
jgi:RHS repeat-associated protein